MGREGMAVEREVSGDVSAPSSWGIGFELILAIARSLALLGGGACGMGGSGGRGGGGFGGMWGGSLREWSASVR